MSFRYSPKAHRALLRTRLELLPKTKQLFFSVWCIEALWMLFANALLAQLGEREGRALSSARDSLIEAALGSPRSDVGPRVSEAIAGLQAPEEGNESMERELFDGSLALAQVMDAVANDLPASAEFAASATIEVIFQHVGLFTDEEESPFSATSVEREVNAQQVMLDTLGESAPTADLLTKGRERPLFTTIES